MNEIICHHNACQITAGSHLAYIHKKTALQTQQTVSTGLFPFSFFIPASNEPKSCLHDLGDCREGEILRSLLRGISLY